MQRLPTREADGYTLLDGAYRNALQVLHFSTIFLSPLLGRSEKIVPLPRKNNREKVYNMVIHVRKLPFGGDFLAINLCGLIFALRDLTPEELNHERIHTAQQRELLFLPFFLWYAAEWLVLMVRYRNRMEAYYRIRFEREAYRHQAEPDYLARRRHYRYLS